jgi:hypothetical protein
MVEHVKSFGIGEVLPRPEGAGFSIGDNSGAPIVTFSYASQAEAVSARKFIEQAIERATSIKGHQRSAPQASQTIPLDGLNASNDE